ncbi:DUF4215 domain-containing protein [Patescibacteria group bacterium]|nr:DUF4215 domain-containing protein [Patescibacteria group bacterium]
MKMKVKKTRMIQVIVIVLVFIIILFFLSGCEIETTGESYLPDEPRGHECAMGNCDCENCPEYCDPEFCEGWDQPGDVNTCGYYGGICCEILGEPPDAVCAYRETGMGNCEEGWVCCRDGCYVESDGFGGCCDRSTGVCDDGTRRDMCEAKEPPWNWLGNGVTCTPENCQVDGPPPEPICGNGQVEEGEECDDGNTDDGDGCSSVCMIEPQERPCEGYACYYDANNNLHPEDACSEDENCERTGDKDDYGNDCGTCVHAESCSGHGYSNGECSASENPPVKCQNVEVWECKPVGDLYCWDTHQCQEGKICSVVDGVAECTSVSRCETEGVDRICQEGPCSEGMEYDAGNDWCQYNKGLTYCCNGCAERENAEIGFCNDTIDNDCDGYTDLDDSDCPLDKNCRETCIDKGWPTSFTAEDLTWKSEAQNIKDIGIFLVGAEYVRCWCSKMFYCDQECEDNTGYLILDTNLKEEDLKLKYGSNLIFYDKGIFISGGITKNCWCYDSELDKDCSPPTSNLPLYNCHYCNYKGKIIPWQWDCDGPCNYCKKKNLPGFFLPKKDFVVCWRFFTWEKLRIFLH